jgi:transposase
MEATMAPDMMIGIDLGKHVFFVHAQDGAGSQVFRRKLSRMLVFDFFATLPPSTVAMEACGGAHFMARKLSELGHQPKLICPQFVSPFVKSVKNDYADAEAICEAASRPSMRFVTPKNESQQALSALHQVRRVMMRDRISTANQIQSFLLEFGVGAPRGRKTIKGLATLVSEQVPSVEIHILFERLRLHYEHADAEIQEIDKEIRRRVATDALAKRLLTIPGVGFVTASALSAELGDGKQFRSGRDFAASIGLVPTQKSTGGVAKLAGISKRGDRKLRTLLVLCARAYITHLSYNTGFLAQWVRSMKERRHINIVACALANKIARIAWAIARNETVYQSEGKLPT